MQRLPGSAKQLMLDIGVCHYMLIFEDAKGSLSMFDFGPIGGDVHVSTPDLQGPSEQPKSKSVAGEIRYRQVSPFPARPPPDQCIASTACHRSTVPSFRCHVRLVALALTKAAPDTAPHDTAKLSSCNSV